jgi:nucleoid-associated protein YgaU
MMLNGKLIYLAYLAIAGVLGVGGFYLVPKILDRNEPAVVAEQPPAESGEASQKSGRVADDAPAASTGDEPEEVEVAKADPQEAAPDVTAKAVVPTFDIVRVEPDGSLVIAGTGDANGTIEVLDGEATIATTDAGPSGDFVAILDEPLAPGDYQLQLLSIAPDGTRTLSEEIATVSIPHGEADQLLAMVGKPGAPSRILTQPEPAKNAAPREMASAEPGQAVATDETSAPQPTVEPSSETMGMPEMPAGSGDLSGTAPLMDAPESDQSEAQVSGQSSDPASALPDAAATGSEIKTETETAALAPEMATPEAEPGSEPAGEPAPAPEVNYTIRVDAVEIEDDTIYVAGAATPGLEVRVLADNAPIGSTKSGEGGRFIVEAPVKLSVGEHQIAAELLVPGGNDVAMRAVVPFNRPEGARMAAVAAKPEDAATGGDPSVAGDAPASDPAGTPSNTVEQDRLTPASGSVIIRKGDTLWEISRRTYGQGVRYTTIYLANQQQLPDPDRISPGQVFNVPEKWDENAEKTHHDLLEQRKHSTD